MKKILIVSLLCLILVSLSFARMVPYVALSVNARLAYLFSEEISDSTNALDTFMNFFEPFKMFGDMTADVGFINQFNETSSLIGMVELQSYGPAIADEYSSSFSPGETQQNQVIIVKYIHKFSDTLLMRGTADYFNQFYRLSKDEDMGDGLYDFSRLGASAEVEYILSDTFNLMGDVAYHYNFYPNYYDLYNKYFDQTSGTLRDLTQSETEKFDKYRLPMNNHNPHLFASAEYGINESFFINGDYTFEVYSYPQSIIYDQTKTSAEKQLDILNNIIVGGFYKTAQLQTGLNVLALFSDSNQWYPMMLGGGGYLSKNFTLRQWGFQPYINMSIRESDTFGAACTVQNLYYPNLPIIRENGDWADHRQTQNVVLLNVFYIFSPRQYIYISHSLAYKYSASNSKASLYNYSIMQYALSVKYEY